MSTFSDCILACRARTWYDKGQHGPLAQWQSTSLITTWFQVRILGGPPHITALAIRVPTLPAATFHTSSEAFMARTLQTIRSYFPDHTSEYRISKAALERLTDAFYRMDRSGYVLPRHQSSTETELPALANYGRAVNGLLAEWQDVRLAFDREMKRRDDDGAIQGLLDQLDVL